jgi:hypothetical protein
VPLQDFVHMSPQFTKADGTGTGPESTAINHPIEPTMWGGLAIDSLDTTWALTVWTVTYWAIKIDPSFSTSYILVNLIDISAEKPLIRLLTLNRQNK